LRQATTNYAATTQATIQATAGRWLFGDFTVLQVTINGDPRQFGRDLAVTELLDELALAGKRVAIERNGEIVPRSRYAQTRLANGDQLEIVVAVGGG
jgi:sulfur carrier protein